LDAFAERLRTPRGILPIMVRPAVDVQALSREEQLALLDELWEVLGRDPDVLPLTDEQRRDLGERLDALEREGPVGLSWAETLAHVRAPR
jgi:putative addiction module component (TIGR02574 family)